MPYKDPETGHWYTDIRPRHMGKPTGKRVRKLMPKVRGKAEAVEEERRIRKDIQAELSGERKVSPEFEEFAKGEYLRWVRGNRKRPREDERDIDILCASPHFKRRLDEVTPDHVEKFKADCRATISNRGRRWAPGYVNGYLVQLSSLFRQAVASGKAKTNPVRAVRYLELEPPTFRILRHDEEPRLMESLQMSQPHMKPLAQMALLTGMRLGELLNLRVEDVDFGRDTLRVRDPKSPKDKRKTEGVPISREARALLLSLKVRRGLFFSTRSGGKLRQTVISSCFAYCAKRAGLGGLTFHSLRHTFGTRLGEQGHSVPKIMRLMGHSTPKMTALYVHPAEESLRAAVETLSARPKVLDFPQTGQRADGGA